MTAALEGTAAQALLVFQILLALGAAFSRQHRSGPSKNTLYRSTSAGFTA